MTNHTPTKDFQVDENVLNDFKQFLGAQDISYSDQDLNGVMDWVKANIKAEIFTSTFGQMEGLKIRANWDPMVNQALTYIPQAATLEQAAEKLDTQKTVTAKNAPATPATE